MTRMTNAELIAALEEYPKDAKVELGKFLAVDRVTDEPCEVRLDFPIIGLGHNEETNELIFVVSTGENKAMVWLRKFGKVTKLGEWGK